MRIECKTALVTGGAHRVGKAITLALAGAGANVVINYHRSADAAAETAGEAREMGVEALAVQADVASHDDVRRMVAAAAERFGGVDILVNSASPWERTPFPMEDVTPWHRVTRTLIDGPFYCANAVAPWMSRQGDGVIINMLDLSAWEPWPGFTAHSVGKTALLALTRQLALELAPAVRANGIAPGLVLPPPGTDEEEIERMAERTLLKRWGAPADVAEAVLFLVCSDYITGEVIVVDGGQRFNP
jgi:NAD(P)-dependent dehydrogenase (short-subunit alcohol dehydrogenase family)